MKNVFTAVAVLLLSTALVAQQPVFWPEGHPPETHTHTSGNGHHGEGNTIHGGWGYGHHKNHGPGEPCTPECGQPCPPECETPCGSAPVPEPTTLILTGVGIAAAGMASRRRKKAAQV